MSLLWQGIFKTMNIQSVDISILKTKLNNVKNHNKRNIDSIKKSLIEFNQYKPLIVNSNYEILVGKGTYLAMKQLNYKTVEVIKKELTEQQEKQLIVLDNRTSQLSDINTEMVEKILYDLDSQKINLTAYNDKQIENIMNNISNKQMDDQTEKINEGQIICPFCKNKFSLKQD